MTKEKPKLNLTFKIENIVASADLGVELDLYGIARSYKSVDYEPEQFPGAIFKIDRPKMSLLLFKNGKIICTGAKSEKDVAEALEKVVKIVEGHILQPSNEESEEGNE